MKYRSLIITFVVSVIIGGVFGSIYFNDHSWGAWGDDSAGYIYLAGLMERGEDLVYYDDLVFRGYEFFQDERLSRWLTPTHHFLINQQGTIASKYPVGLSILMAAAERVFSGVLGEYVGFYGVIPFVGALNLVLVYLLALQLFSENRYRHGMGALAAVMLGLSTLYYDYAIAQPMRELPSITFLLLAAIALYAAAARFSVRWQSLVLLAVSGVAFGFAITIRETSILVLPALLVFALLKLWKNKKFVAKRRIHIAVYSGIFLITMMIGLIPTIQNSVAISAEKEVFKARDTSEIVLLPNAGHIETISVQNIFDNQGKFRPGKGSLPHYWGVMQDSMPVPYFLVFVFLGIAYLWRESRAGASMLVLWILGTLTIFSLWVNPYSRYILPLFPPLFLLGSYGVFMFVMESLPQMIQQKWLVRFCGGLVALTILCGYQPTLNQVAENMRTDVYRFKAISHEDLENLVSIADRIQQSEVTVGQPLLLFSGEWQYGTSETLEAHTGLKTIRSPFEQGKFVFNENDVNTFLDTEVVSTHDTYIWVDSTSSVDTLEWLSHYNYESIGSYDFTFQTGVSIYAISKK